LDFRQPGTQVVQLWSQRLYEYLNMFQRWKHVYRFLQESLHGVLRNRPMILYHTESFRSDKTQSHSWAPSPGSSKADDDRQQMAPSLTN
jgi:hypothetical protein